MTAIIWPPGRNRYFCKGFGKHQTLTDVFPMTTILVPTDFSKNAANAVDFAVALARRVKGRLLLIHTVELPASSTPEGLILLPVDTSLVEDCEEELQKQAEQIRLQHAFQFEVDTFCLYGSLVGQLNELIRTQAVDLVVMGTSGASNFIDRFIGTNTASFIKAAHCPVLAIPANVTFKGFHKIAYATDFEGEETVFLKHLFQFAAPFKSEVSIVNVRPEEQRELVSDYKPLKEITKHYPGNEYQVVLLPGSNVVKSLKTFVAEHHMDLLAVSIHERGFWDQLFHKSITKELAYQAFIPLLALPEEPYQTLPSSWSGKLKPQPVQ